MDKNVVENVKCELHPTSAMDLLFEANVRTYVDAEHVN